MKCSPCRASFPSSGTPGACFSVIGRHRESDLQAAADSASLPCLPALQTPMSRVGVGEPWLSPTNWLQDPCHFWVSVSSSAGWCSLRSLPALRPCVPESAVPPRARECCPWIGGREGGRLGADHLRLCPQVGAGSENNANSASPCPLGKGVPKLLNPLCPNSSLIYTPLC